MAAYVIVELEIIDAEGYSDYSRLVPPTLAAYDGKFLVRGGASEPLEGSWHPQRLVVLEFPSVARAREWWDSPEYSEAKAARQRTAATQMIVVEGIA